MKRVYIRDMVGVPYRVHGRDPSEGLDCYGVCIVFYGRAGIELADVFYMDVKETGLTDKVERAVKDGLPFEMIEAPEYGCIVDIRIPGSSSRHIGVYVGDGMMLHATREAGVCVQRVARYGSLVRGYWRIADDSCKLV